MLDTGGANVLRLEEDTADPYASALGGGGGGDSFAAQVSKSLPCRSYALQTSLCWQ